MSIRRDLVIKVSNGTATLDMPLQIYEKDHGIELRFKLMDYKYKYDKDPENILNSNKEDILEAYTTIVNPSGYELAQINGEVVDDTIKFMIEDSYTDELEELGTYQLQIHVKCKHSEFSIPPVRFEVLERLKGEKVVTDGDDEVDYSDIIDGSTKFIDDETGKLIIQWQKGDTISSVRLNAMVEVINNAVDEEAQRQLNEEEREQQELEREQQELERENRLQAALNSVDARVDASMNDYETRFNALTVSQQQDMEVIDARDSEVSLKARLDRDISNPLQVYEDVEGSYISCDSTDGYIQNVELLGNTIQDADNLADIRSVGDKIENQELYEIDVLSCGKNLAYYKIEGVGLDGRNPTTLIDSPTGVVYIAKVKPGNYVASKSGGDRNRLGFFKTFPSIGDKATITKIPGDTLPNAQITVTEYGYIAYCTDYQSTSKAFNIQIEEGTVATEYEPYQENKLTILSPVQLEKVGDVADRIICKDGVWGVEKNIKTYVVSQDSIITLHLGVENGTSSYRIENVFEQFEAVVITSKFKQISFSNLYVNKVIGHATHEENKHLYVRFESDGNVDTAKQQLQGMVMKYATLTPQFIPLPHDQQIKLRTFAGKTNISFLTEIEPTLKAQIPHSLGATINSHSEQINNLSEELDRVKKLEETTVSTVTTESEFTTVTETANGYFEDVKVEGKTLVNLYENKDKLYNARFIYSDSEILNLSLLKPNTKYTVIIYGSDKVYTSSLCDVSASQYLYSKNYGNTCVFTTPNDFSVFTEPIRVYVYSQNTDPFTEGEEKNIKVVLLEGDHTQNPPGYFEGLMSVGEDIDEMSVTSGENKHFPLSSEYTMQSSNKYSHRASDVMKSLTKAKMTNISDKVIELNLFNRSTEKHSDTVYIYPDKTVDLDLSTSYVKWFYFSIDRGWDYSSAFNLHQHIVVNGEYNKKSILYYNNETQAWEKPVLREWDSIEKHSDGKYYYHKRSREVVLNGSERWGIDNQNNGLECVAVIPSDGRSPDKVIPTKYNGNWRSSATYGNRIYVLANVNTLEDFVNELKAKPATVIYPLAQEEVYECTDLDLIAYADETNLIVKSGALSPKTTLKVYSNAANVVTLLQKKALKLEESAISRDRKIAAIETKLETPAVQVEGSYISCDSTDGYIQNVEILGNTIQDADNLADIRSVGDKVEGQELYEIPVVSVKGDGNLFNKNDVINSKVQSGTGIISSTTEWNVTDYIRNISCDVYISGISNSAVSASNIYIGLYDENKTFITFLTKPVANCLIKSSEFNNCSYFVTSVNNKDLSTMQIEYNSTATPYKPYQEDKLTILSPVQLEKVGDVADRIVCKDGVWGVKKNIGRHVLSSGDSFTNYSYDENYRYAAVKLPNHSTTVYVDRFIASLPMLSNGHDKKTTPYYRQLVCHSTDGVYYITPEATNLDELLLDVDKVKPVVLYQFTEPQFIPLPHDQQVKLRTFAGETNISFLTEIEPTLKAQIPQSINTTISTHTEQIDNLNKELGKVKKLEESTVSTVTTESGFTTVTETTNGYFEDVKLEGKTLVNLADKTRYNETIEGWKTTLGNRELYKTNTVYTFIGKVTALSDGVALYINAEGPRRAVLKKGYNITIFETGDSLDFITIYSIGSPGAFNIENVVILEGDHTQNPPGYFEGLMSVGEDVEEMSVESKNKNRLHISENYDWKYGTAPKVVDNVLYGGWAIGYKIYLEKGEYVFSCNRQTTDNSTPDPMLVKLKDVSTDTVLKILTLGSLGELLGNFTVPHDGEYIIMIDNQANIDVSVISDIQFCNAELYTGYVPYKSNKKPLLYYNQETQVWEKPILREWDSIEKHSDGKYYYHKRSGEVVLDGSENWQDWSPENWSETSLLFNVGASDLNVNFKGALNDTLLPNLLCSHFNIETPNKLWSTDGIEGITIAQKWNLQIRILKSKLSTQNLAGFKAWLQANPTTVVYESATEEVYECINIDLITYENETNYIVNAGAIDPKSTLKVICNINNVVRELQQKVSNLENYIQHVMIDALNNALDE